ncbi:CehA/McbA family metallohydrolase [Haladaptatus pallidirubidus]|uniref:CehA/McbA family metallohydrolase n=1 Tax=Haladaptatus pallidirubidus TaxID=1008152 RepID=A0AAV3UR17_9EURY|nr:CehA/McbA family metallohydrolase [Haladaptatus pallidirubidus]
MVDWEKTRPMARDLLRDGQKGRFFRGNLHCHSIRSDGLLEPEEIVEAYRDAGYDFLCLSDHFEEEYGYRITDTRPFRNEDFTTILGAELSSAPWEDRNAYWVTAAGLPADFEPSDDHAEAIRRGGPLGAFVVLLHPGLNNLTLEAADGLPGLEAVDAVEIYNHNNAMAAVPDRADGAYMLDGLLERGHRLLVNAGDDAHFGHPKDRFGGWVEVYCDHLDPDALLSSLKVGRYYSTQGPALRELVVDGDKLFVETSEAYAISLTTSGDRWQSGAERTGEPVVEAEFDLTPFRGSYCRVTVVDSAGRRAWSNPVWP